MRRDPAPRPAPPRPALRAIAAGRQAASALRYRGPTPVSAVLSRVERMNDRAAAAGAGQAPAIYRATPPPQAAPVDPAEVRLPRPPGIFRRWLAAHPRAVDVSIVVCYLFGCALMALHDFGVGFTASGDQGPPKNMPWPDKN